MLGVFCGSYMIAESVNESSKFEEKYLEMCQFKL